jgi:hypothetical protein
MKSKSRRARSKAVGKEGSPLADLHQTSCPEPPVVESIHSRMSSDGLAGATLSLHLTKACRTNTSIESQRTWWASNRRTRKHMSPYVSEALGRRLA